MFFKKAFSVAAVVVAVGFSAAGCTDDKKKTAEAVGAGGSGENGWWRNGRSSLFQL